MPIFKAKKEKSVAGLIVKSRTPDEKPEENQEDDPSAAIKSCASALINAVHSNDTQGVADALSDAFSILESMPHEEAEQAEPHSYESQNAKAAE